MIRKIYLGLLLTAVLVPPGTIRANEVIDLPLTRAVLYASGVGYFEHEPDH